MICGVRGCVPLPKQVVFPDLTIEDRGTREVVRLHEERYRAHQVANLFNKAFFKVRAVEVPNLAA
jgi:hypothetical protein